MPTKHPWRLSEVTLKDVRSTNYQVAVLPFGATEPHNLHLPYATDNIEVTEICDRACEFAWKQGAKVALLPTVPFGCDQNMLTFPMTISVDQAQLDGIVESVAKSLERHGVQKLVVVNGHGGNQFQPGIRTLYGRSSVFVSLMSWYQVAAADGGQKVFENNDGDHADEMETSVVLALTPELVNMADADAGATRPSRFEGGRKGWVWYPRPWEKLTTNSGAGNPSKGNAEKGKKFIQLAVERMGGYFTQLASEPRDKFFPLKGE